ncbi:cyclic pyranopterin monophosphate synthase [Geobacter sp. OR-1]|uniref:radical SAM protein n=1 Tax=Geobacter sp. OR-1 TaxID=1266765 RepID=UPI0005439F6E|nr:radical SAM protein [Geobacter sp. OR-1]GAM10560.1 cyclic pyranopterin monophosphate synthase [Geobacter sp. OR-1]
MGLLYTRMKIFRFPEKLDSLSRDSDEILPPLHVRIKPTNACNHGCWYCAYRADALQLGQDMKLQDAIPREKMLEIIDDIADMGVRAVTFSGGGDPFCYSHLPAAIERLAATPVRFAALTNGALLHGRLAELFAHNATWIRISMDGWDDASYREYRGCADGEFSRILANMEAFRKIGGSCYLGVSLIVDNRNCSQILALIRRLKDAGVDSVKVSPCIVSNSGVETNAYHQPILATVKDQLGRAIAEYSGPEFEIFDSFHLELETFAKGYHWCPYLQITPVIGADQNVYSCHDKAYNLKDGLLGSIRTTRFKEFWQADKERFFQIDPSVVCNHHCVVDNSNRQILEYLGADPVHLGFV